VTEPKIDPRSLVLAQIAHERNQQDAKWGEQNHPDGTGIDWAVEVLPAYPDGTGAAQIAKLARRDCQRAASRNACTWLKIAREEIAEAFAETDPGALRGELVQTAAVFVAWIEALDRRQPW
jgi:hypothetical protein